MKVSQLQASVPIAATSDAGVPVEYFVPGSLAELVGNILHFTEIPFWAKDPANVNVVAW